jgi:hypothetical protein
MSQFISSITHLFTSQIMHIEFAAVSCITRLVRLFRDAVAPSVVAQIFERMRSSPAIEYVRCLEQMIRFMSRDVIRQTVFPITLEFFKMSESHQYAAAELFLVLPIADVEITNDHFLLVLNSQITVGHYLVAIVKKLEKTFNTNWFENSLPKHLLLQSNSFSNLREGSIRAIISLIGHVDSPQIHLLLMTAFGWATNTESIAIAIAEHSDLLSSYRTGEFQSKVIEIGLRLSKSSSIVVRSKLCSIYSNNPVTFLSSDAHVTRVFKGIVDDPEIEVRLSYVTHFPILYGRCLSVQLTDVLFSLLLPFFSCSDPRVHEAIIGQPDIFHVLNTAKLNALLRGFFRLFESLTRWRVISAAIGISLGFPPDIFPLALSQLIIAVKSKLCLHPFVLGDATTNFFVAVVLGSPEEDVLGHAVDFSRSSNHQVRSFFLRLAIALGQFLSGVAFLERLWPAALLLAEDPVVSVRASFLRCSCPFRQLFARYGETAADKHLTTVFMIMGKDGDPLLQAVWLECAESFSRPPRRPDLERIPLKEQVTHQYRSANTLHVANPDVRPRLVRPLAGQGAKRKWAPEGGRRSLLPASRAKV